MTTLEDAITPNHDLSVAQPQRHTGPGIAETAAMSLAVFLLIANVPTEWVVVRAQGDLDAGGSAFVALLFIAVAGFLGIQMNGRWTGFFQIVGREPLLLAFLVWSTMSALWSEDVPFSVRRAIALLVASYLGAHFVLRFSQFAIMRILGLNFAAVAFINLIWIFLFPQFSGPAQGQTPDNVVGFDARLTGIYDNANTLGRITALGAFTMLAAARLDRRFRVVYLAGFGAGVLSLLLSQSQTSFVVTILTSLLLIGFLIFRARKQLFGAVFVLVVGATLVSVIAVVTNLELITGALDRDVTLSGRVPLWGLLFDELQRRPIFGFGYAGYWNGWGSPSHELWNLIPWRPPHGHQQYIDVMLTTGVIGLALFTALIVRTFVRSTRYIRDIKGSFGLWPLVFMCFFQLNTMTEAGLVGRDIVWFLLVAVVVLVSTRKKELVEDELQPPSPEALPSAAT